MIRRGRLPFEPALVMLAALSAVLVAGCRCGSDQAKPEVKDAAAAPTCRRGSAQLTLSGGVAAKKVDPDLDPSVELPFAPEPGVGLAIGEQLFATGLRRDGRSTIALLARFGPEPDSQDLVELARLQNDAAPPRLASDGGRLIIGLQETTSSGYELRVAQLDPAHLRSSIDWRSAPAQTKDESNVFGLAASEGRTVVVWDEWLAGERQGRVAISVFAEGPAAPARPLSDPGVDAETPRISVRPGGYWVAWLVNLDAVAGHVYDPGSEGGRREQQNAGPDGRGIELVALDSGGQRAGEPIRVTAPDERVVGYDLTTSPAGFAWIVWRHDTTSAGASGGRISMAEVRADGGVEIALLEERAVGAGEPSWLPAGDERGPWLTFPDEADQTQLFRLQRPLALSEPLVPSADFGRAAALGVARDKVLFAAPRGADVELFPALCDVPGVRAPVSRRPSAALPIALVDAGR